MIKKIEITINVIVHATEDVSKILKAFEEVLDLRKEDFLTEETKGHYENPIIMLKANIVKRRARELMESILERLPARQIDELIKEIGQRTTNSRFHMRLDKQELIKGNLTVREHATVKLRIHTPVYNKKDTVKTFTEIFQIAN